jgi:hypothetical protein
MNLRKLPLGLLCMFVFGLALQVARAQDEPQQTPPDQAPKPAARSIPGADDQDDQNPNVDPNALQPDFTPLTGLQNATLGMPEIRHSYWVPGLQYGAYVQSSPYGSNSSSWYVDNYVAGNLTLLEAWSRSTLSLNYSGGAYFSAGDSSGSGQYQELAFTETYHGQRWLLQISDYFSYLPETAFGFGGGTNLGVPGVGGTLGLGGVGTAGLGNNYIPNQSIYGVGPAYSNAGMVQATYALSRRSSITVSGSYGILNYINAGNIDTNSLIGGFGYNYQLSKSDTIGVVYFFSSYHYPGEPQAYGNHVASLAYGRKLTGRLALRLLGGPQISTFRIPIGTSTSQIGGYFYGTLSYALRNGGISATYSHSLSGGSGVLVGSTLDEVNLQMSRRLTRVWSGNINFGYAHNGEVASGELDIPTYDSWFAGGGLNRPIGRNLSVAVAYQANIGNYKYSACTGASCSSNNSVQTVTVNFQWHTRPFVLP